ncbi:O-antigen translocase [Novipirellula artificiosorum]|uniref:Colanic acid exporter n=1 Tax=Novipirellula artificiosorum TaxID=2528016 RepID=A0A5C6DA08_9BACT|nr:O-antigen translocase [Novipirellula artificiosorum]TWU32601.1 colanic acid exporter [Novipirellula artificiosorum]
MIQSINRQDELTTREQDTRNSIVSADHKSESNSYGQVLKASSIIGGSQVVTVIIGMVRTKLVAMLIGPTGIGLVGMFQSITGLAAIIAGLGIQTSGVRDVAVAAGAADERRIAETVLTLRRVCWLTGLLGCFLLYLSAGFLSQKTFGSLDYVWAIRLLGLTILMGNIAGGQSAIIQGTRRIGDLARMRVLSAVGSTVVAVGFYVWMGIDGIIPALLAIGAITLAVSTYFAQRVPIQKSSIPLRESLRQARGLLNLGLAFVWSGLMATLVAYLTRVWIAAEIDLRSVGIYTAAFGLSGLFVQFVLQAMGADYYPRLTAVAHDPVQMNQLINQQTEIGLLLAFPGLLATLALAPLAIALFYTAEFAPAAGLLRWFVLGCMGRVISWPLGFSMLALSRGNLFALTETIFNLLHLAGIWVGLHYFGLQAVAVAFAFLYLVCTAGMLITTHYLTGFRWNHEVIKLLAWMIPVALVVLLLDGWLSPAFSSCFGVIATMVATVLCLRHLVTCLGTQHRISKTLLRIPGGIWFTRGLNQA